MSDDLKTFAEAMKNRPPEKETTHCPRCGHKLDVARRADDDSRVIIRYIRFCGPCHAKGYES